MHIDLTPEALLMQLEYSTSETLLSQMKRIFSETKDFKSFSQHLLSLKDEIEHYGGYIAMSNSHDHLKVKTDSLHDGDIDRLKETLKKWAEKYKVKLRRVGKSGTYYIIGKV